MEIQLSELLISLGSLAILVLGTTITYYINKFLKSRSLPTYQILFDQYADEAIDFAIDKFKDTIKENKKEINPEIENEMIAAAMNYVVKNARKTIKEVGADEDAIRDKLVAFINRRFLESGENKE